jgi:hypothetical protein
MRKRKYFSLLFKDDTTWFGSEIPLNRRHILDNIQLKTTAEYEQQHAQQQDQYRTAKGKWPHISEYGDQFVLRTAADRNKKTE